MTAFFLMPFAHSLWDQVYAFLRSRGINHHDAEDGAQGVFRHLAALGVWGGETSKEGETPMSSEELRRLAFIIAKRQWIDRCRREQALKRGGGVPTVPIENAEAGHPLSSEPMTPDTQVMYREIWAAWEAQLNRLENEIEGAQRRAVFQRMRPFLMTGERAERLDELSKETHLSSSVLRVQVHRWRRRLADRFQKAHGDWFAETRCRRLVA